MSKPPTPKQILGKDGESRALTYLQDKKYHILTTNFRGAGCEIDIIARDKNEIVFVEVKTRTKTYGIHPSEAVDYKKLNHIFRAGIEYLKQNHIQADYRCDVVSVLPDSIEHFENVSME